MTKNYRFSYSTFYRIFKTVFYCVRNTYNRKNVTEKRPFALGGGAPRMVESIA